MPVAARPDAWFPFRVPRPTARVRLICLPFAGGAAVTYKPWVAALPPWIEVCPLELPGRGTRLGEPLLASMPEIVRYVVQAVEPLTDRPLAIFGHSMGARIGFELARALARPPVHLFASGAPAPDIPRHRMLSHLSDDALIAELGKMNGAPAAVLADRDLMSLLLPILRNDLRVVETYRGVVETPLDVPITVFTGSDDQDVPLDTAEAWARCTSHPAGAAPLVFTGGHFFIDPHGERVRAEVARRLSASLEATATP